jgi:membrane protease YdiL (CAAX protease family)
VLITPGAAYDQLATSPHRWWLRGLVGIAGVCAALSAMLAVAIAVFVIGFAAGRPTGPDGAPTFGAIGDLAWQLVALAVFTPAVLLAAVLLQRRPAGTLASVTGRLRWAWLGACLLAAFAFTVVSVAGLTALTVVTSGHSMADELGLADWVGWRGFAIAVAVLLPLVPLQAAAEEFLFRGWLLQAMGGRRWGRWIGVGVSAVAFALAHGLGTVWGFLDLVTFGVLMAWLTIRTGGLEAAVGLHVAGNLVALIWSAAFGTLASPETAADSSWVMFAVDVPMQVLYVVVVIRLAGRRGIDVVAPAGAAGEALPSGPLEAALPSGPLGAALPSAPLGAAPPSEPIGAALPAAGAGAVSGDSVPVSGPGPTPR